MIFTTIKEAMGIQEDDLVFDLELYLYISSAIEELKVIGVEVAPHDLQNADWDIFPSSNALDITLMGMIKQFLFVRTKILFDPPQQATMKVLEEHAQKLLWHIQTHYDNFKTPVSGPVIEEEVIF